MPRLQQRQKIPRITAVTNARAKMYQPIFARGATTSRSLSNASVAASSSKIRMRRSVCDRPPGLAATRSQKYVPRDSALRIPPHAIFLKQSKIDISQDANYFRRLVSGFAPNNAAGRERYVFGVWVISNFRKEHDDGARLGRIGIARNRLCDLPLKDIVREVERCVNPASPWIFACAIQSRQLEIERLPIGVEDHVKEQLLRAFHGERNAMRRFAPV